MKDGVWKLTKLTMTQLGPKEKIMDIVLFVMALLMVVSFFVTAIASVSFIVFIVMLAQEAFRKRRTRSLVVSDFVTAERRLAV